ncbi:MAG: hypothetical protein KA253_03650 [Campylobacteraceae bacterium]|nr:hypothetical protein [Campylobacteraceae bacterium]
MKINSALNSNTINQQKNATETVLSKIGATRELSGKDNASLIIANSLNSQIASYTQQVQNENEKVGMLQIADGALSNISDNTLKLEELSVKYNNAILSSDQKNILKNEFQTTKSVIDDIASKTSYNGQALFGNNSPLQLSSVATDKLSIDNQDSIAALKEQVGSLFSDVGASMQSSQSSINTLLTSANNASASYATISEQPMDVKINDINTSNIQLQASMIAQSHQTQTLQQQMATLLR